MVSVTSRPWRGYEDVPALQNLALEARRLEDCRATWHVGDVAWGLRQHAGREHEWRIRLWEDDGRVVAWSWLRMDRATLDHLVHPDYRALLDEVLDEPDAREAFSLEDDQETVAALARHGFTRPGEAMDLNARAVAKPPAAPALPDGFRLRSVDPGDLAERVAVHRDVWAPSRVTEESYANVMRAWPYRASLDCVVEAPDGRFAAYCLLWPDDENGVGELEPVGTREEFRGRGLGAAVCAFALRRWHDECGRQAIVYCVTEPARALYRSLGFERHTAVVGFAR
jgi:ribosomal protein S18 acetylase RimI-like enzyme